MTQPIWITPAGSIGAYPSNIRLRVQLVANFVDPATEITYKLVSGALPSGVILTIAGVLIGTPELVSKDTFYTFVVRATDNLGNIRDRTFSLVISGIVTPEFSTPPGNIFDENPLDSTWVEFPIQYSNPISTNEVSIRVVQGQLPPGLEINKEGLIRGYAKPPTLNVNVGLVITAGLTTSSETNIITCLSTRGFLVNRPVVFTGTVLGGIIAGQTYYVNSIIDSNSFTISNTSGGPILALSTEVGYMDITLPNITVGQPTVQTYSFTLRLESAVGGDIETYSITVVNQNALVSEGGPGSPPNTRVPSIYNTRPATYNIDLDSTNFGYYVLPDDTGNTYDPDQAAFIGRISSDNIFSFKVLGKDFDGTNLTYIFNGLPLGLVGDPVTGWITGNPEVSSNNISDFSFSVAVAKSSNPTIRSSDFNFSFRITNNLLGDIDWITPEDLGIIENGTLSNLNVLAQSDVELQYRIIDGTLPPNLFLLENGEITGTVAYQPVNTSLLPNSLTNFTFTAQAYSPIYSVVQSNRTFSVSVIQEYTQPTDTLYIKCTPSIDDRMLIKTLLEDSTLIPAGVLYRPQDVNFGKASNITYAHVYGVHANYIDAYVNSVTKNHYWRNITLGELKTAVAKNSKGEIIYEVVYSQIVDNLTNPDGVSISEEIVWRNQTLYPNSLENMRNRVGSELGQDFNFRLYPRWMTSQQKDGSTLGYVPAWIICYTKPGYSDTIKQNIETNWKDDLGNTLRLNEINFKLDRFTVDKSATYNYDTLLNPPAWTGLPSATPVPDPKDENDFHVLYPRKTILPD